MPVNSKVLSQLSDKKFIMNVQLTLVGAVDTVPAITVPGQVSQSGSQYAVDIWSGFAGKANVFPAVQAVQFSLDRVQAAAGAVNPCPIFIWNPVTGQVVTLQTKAPVGNNSEVVTGCVPFFVLPNQTIFVASANGATAAACNVTDALNLSFLTFDAPTYFGRLNAS